MYRAGLVARTVFNKAEVLSLSNELYGHKRQNDNDLIQLMYVADNEINKHDALRGSHKYHSLIQYTFVTIVDRNDLHIFLDLPLQMVREQLPNKMKYLCYLAGTLNQWKIALRDFDNPDLKTIFGDVRDVLVRDGYKLIL